MMESDHQPKVSLRERVVDELKEFVILTAYLFVCFAAILYFKAAILHSQGVVYSEFVIPIIKAALCAKFMLLGRMLHLGEHKNRPLIVPTIHMSFAFLVLLIVLIVVEEAVAGLIHGRPILESISEMAGGTVEQKISTSLIILLILVPYFALRSIGSVVGDRTLVRLFFERRHGNLK